MKEFINYSGNTPLIKISNKLYAKLETYSPTGSVKDRMITYIVNKAIKDGKINNNTILCEATSGNSGISLSSVAANLGLKCKIFMPSNMSEERRQMMKIYGAEIIDAPPSDFEAAIKMRDDYLINNQNAWSPLQFNNPDNVECHREITGPEINSNVLALGEQWSVFIHGSGTGGTIEGIRQFVRFNNKNTYTKVCMVVPEEKNHGIQGIGDGKDFLANPDNMDHILSVSTPDAIDRAKKFAKETGLLVGISSGANLAASEKYLENNNIEGIIITILCDRGERYMSIY